MEAPTQAVPIPIENVRRMDDPTLAAMRHTLGNRVQGYVWRAEMEGPNSDRDATGASYAALLAMVDAERARRRDRDPLDSLRCVGRPFAQVHVPDAEFRQHGGDEDAHVDQSVVGVPGVDSAHELYGCEVGA